MGYSGLPFAGGGGGGGGTSSTDRGAFSAGITDFTPAGGTFKDGAAILTDGLMAIVRLTAYRAFHVNLRDNSGNEVGILAAPVRNQQVGTADVDIDSLGGNAILVGNGVTGTGSQRVTIASDNTPFPVKIDQTTPGTTNLVAAGGVGALDAVLAGNPVRIGARGVSTTLPTIVTTARLVDLLADRFGRQYVVSPICTVLGSNTTPITLAAPTTTQIVAAPSAGNHIRVHRLWAQNFGATASVLTGYWSDGTTKRIPFSLLGNQPFSMAVNGSWELATASALNIISTAATSSPSVEWFVAYEVLAD